MTPNKVSIQKNCLECHIALQERITAGSVCMSVPTTADAWSAMLSTRGETAG